MGKSFLQRKVHKSPQLIFTTTITSSSFLLHYTAQQHNVHSMFTHSSKLQYSHNTDSLKVSSQVSFFFRRTSIMADYNNIDDMSSLEALEEELHFQKEMLKVLDDSNISDKEEAKKQCQIEIMNLKQKVIHEETRRFGKLPNTPGSSKFTVPFRSPLPASASSRSRGKSILHKYSHSTPANYLLHRHTQL